MTRRRNSGAVHMSRLPKGIRQAAARRIERLPFKIVGKNKRRTGGTLLPLNVESSNQYITQQAALMLLAADYAGGIALSLVRRFLS